ncbi:regulatory protein MerR [Segniliparus rotundus DSM 44985]|uniref:Regulatory protein MerR n=1 Tax=Segniliparus rotundus (strain ATCC BAA-972 / CDC 1076 / CIP 108378 / DSM 44985 / JCM 13578) TaxID=640132 RepID=D6ZAR6_SEGRD|nr:helix-turn-helix domain-containing protein [Segniliparus rotundus]ADG98802.1 regulatory protein MerR [Segniliparus rotundus DSM 44985]
MGPDLAARRPPRPVQLPDGADTLLTASEAAAFFGKQAQTVRAWALRGKLQPAGLTERREYLYRVRDLAQAARDRRRREQVNSVSQLLGEASPPGKALARKTA